MTIALFLPIVLCCGGPASSQILLRKGTHVCRARTPQQRAFLDSIARGDLRLVRKHLEQGVSPNTKDDCNVPALTYAAESLHLDVMKELVVRGADVNSIDDFVRYPALIWVLDSYPNEADDPDENKVWEMVKLLVSAGADVNAKGSSDQGALTLAVLADMEKVVELLIASGSKINARDGQDRTAYSYAAALGNLRLKRMLVAAGADRTIGVKEYSQNYGVNAFIQASADGRTDIVEAMLASGTSVNMVNESKVSALMRATEDSTLDALLGAGADVNLKDDHGFTALAWAAFFGRVNQVNKLIAAGANVNAMVYDGNTILSLAKPDVRPILIAAGAKEH